MSSFGGICAQQDMSLNENMEFQRKNADFPGKTFCQEYKDGKPHILNYGSAFARRRKNIPFAPGRKSPVIQIFFAATQSFEGHGIIPKGNIPGSCRPAFGMGFATKSEHMAFNASKLNSFYSQLQARPAEPSQIQPARIPSGFAPAGNGWNISMLHFSQMHRNDGFQVKFAWNISLNQSFCSQPPEHLPHVVTCPLSHHHWGFYYFFKSQFHRFKLLMILLIFYYSRNIKYI